LSTNDDKEVSAPASGLMQQAIRAIPRETVTAMDRVLADTLRGKASLGYLRICVGACVGAAVSLPVIILVSVLTNFLTPPITALIIAVFTMLGAMSLEYRSRSRVLAPAENQELERAQEAFARTLAAIAQAELPGPEAEKQRQLALQKFIERVEGALVGKEQS
jgi:ABC-type transport system involved in cytochrome bd biosynthesis fused ATPase/permease subunit